VQVTKKLLKFINFGAKYISMISRNLIINAAKRIGFDRVGVVAVEPLKQERHRFEAWLAQGCHSTLSYLERNVDKRFDAGLLVEGARSVIVCAVSYLSTYSRGYASDATTKVASYALARDYHITIKQMLFELAEALRAEAPQLQFRAFTDSAPIAEKSLAVRAGIGWVGRHSLVVNPEIGSMFLLGELIINEDVDVYDKPLEDVGCGTCRACVEACPNGAIRSDRTIDTRRCISCRTIEREGCDAEIKLDGWIFGCDVCQTACPFNRHAPLHLNSRFDALFDPMAVDWLALDDDSFAELAGETPMTRAGRERICRNIGR
jgi:epoxyqueuosine reductase